MNTFSPQTPNIQRLNPNRKYGHWKGPFSAEKDSASRHLTESGILSLQLNIAWKTSFILEIIFFGYYQLILYQGVTKRCRLSWLPDSALVYEPKYGGMGGRGGWGVSANECSCAHGAQINFRDLTPYLTPMFCTCVLLRQHIRHPGEQAGVASARWISAAHSPRSRHPVK